MISTQLPHDCQVLWSLRMKEVYLYIEETVEELRTPSYQEQKYFLKFTVKKISSYPCEESISDRPGFPHFSVQMLLLGACQREGQKCAQDMGSTYSC